MPTTVHKAKGPALWVSVPPFVKVGPKKKMVVLRSGDTLGSPEQLLCLSGPLRPNPHLFVLQDECTAGWKATRVKCPQSVPQVGGFLHLAWFPWSLTGEGVPGYKQQQA